MFFFLFFFFFLNYMLGHSFSFPIYLAKVIYLQKSDDRHRTPHSLSSCPSKTEIRHQLSHIDTVVTKKNSLIPVSRSSHTLLKWIITLHDNRSDQITSRHVTSRHIISHHITSHHITSYYITLHYNRNDSACYCLCRGSRTKGNLSNWRFLRGDGNRKFNLLPIHVSRRQGSPSRLRADFVLLILTSPVKLGSISAALSCLVYPPRGLLSRTAAGNRAYCKTWVSLLWFLLLYHVACNILHLVIRKILFYSFGAFTSDCQVFKVF